MAKLEIDIESSTEAPNTILRRPPFGGYMAQLYPAEGFGPYGFYFSKMGEAAKAAGFGWEYSRLGDVSTFRQFQKLPSIRSIKTLIKALERAE